MKKTKIMILCGLLAAAVLLMMLLMPKKTQSPGEKNDIASETTGSMIGIEAPIDETEAETTPTQSAEEKLRELGFDEIDVDEPEETAGTDSQKSNDSVKPAKPQPKPTEPQPKPTEPQPKPTEPQPKPTEPQPKPTEPDDGLNEDSNINMGETDWD